MLILDTNHFTTLVEPTAKGLQLEARLAAANQDVSITIVTIQESIKGWLDKIHSAQDPRRQIPFYEKLGNLIDYFADWVILPFDARALAQYEELRYLRTRIGDRDLKIAAITLVNQGTLLSANAKHFRLVPGVPVEDWIS